MSENRVRCQAEGCRNSILVATAARTGGICRPCEQEIAREEHVAYVRANQREVDRYAGVTDPVELIALLVAPKKYDELVIEKPFPFDVATFYGSLSAFDLQRVIRCISMTWMSAGKVGSTHSGVRTVA